MPMHDWNRVDAGIFHAFHHSWIEEIHRAMLKRLPEGYYSLPEQVAACFGPDILALKHDDAEDDLIGGGTATLSRPKTKMYQETPKEFYLRRKKSVVIHHVSGDRIVAMIEIVSPGNKNSIHGLRAFVRKARELLLKKIHLLIIDPFPVGNRDQHGLHAAIFEDFQDNPLHLPAESPLSLFPHECDDRVKAYLEPIAVGDVLPDMPVFLYPGMYVNMPLEATYMAAWEAVPRRWQNVIISRPPK